MTVNKIFYNFKSYKNYQNEAKKEEENPLDDINKKALIGSAIGVLTAFGVYKKYDEFITSKIVPQTDKGKRALEIANSKTAKDLAEMLSMAGLANIGGVLGGSIGANNEQKKKKWKEAGFQMMNISIPMLLVAGAMTLCTKIKSLDKIPIKIISSFAGMISGAAIATGITNLTKKEGEAKRKYSLKDSIANFDDVVATLKLGFPNIAQKVPVAKILPFIYGFSGYRSGDKN